MRQEVSKTSAEAIVLGANHHNTYGIIRALSKFHIRPIVIISQSPDDCFYRESKYVKQLLFVPQDKIIKWLIDFGRKCVNIRHTLYISSDSFSELVDCNQEALRDYYYIPGAGIQGMLSKLMDKQVLSDIAVETGLRIPPNSKTYRVEQLSTKIYELNYPCIIKPIKSSTGHKSDICICHNHNELVNSLNRITCDYVQIQDYINKDYEFQLIGLSLNKGQYVIIPGITKVLWAASTSSNTGIVQITPIDSSYDNLIEKVECLIRKFGYTGSFSVEFLRDRTGENYFMEINFRNDGNAIVVTAGGVNLPQIWWNYNNESSTHSYYSEIKITRNAIATPLWSMLSIAKRERKLLKLIRFSFKSSVFMDFTLSDPKPFVYNIINIIKALLKR